MSFTKKLKRKIADYQMRKTFPMAYSQMKNDHVHSCDCGHCHHHEDDNDDKPSSNGKVYDVDTDGNKV